MEKIEIGKIVKEQGIKGDVKIILFADADFDFSSLKKVYIDSQEAIVEKSYSVSGGIGVKFDIINSRIEAGKFRNKLVYANKADIVCHKNRYFIADLINKLVKLDNELEIGVLVDVQNFGSADVLYLSSNERKILASHIDGLIVSVDDQNIVFNAEKFNQVAIYED